MDAPKLISRWSREPSLDKRRARTKDGKPRKRKLSKRDIEILNLLFRFRYLPANDIHAWVGGSYEGVRRALAALYRNGHINRPEQQRRNANANYYFAIYELDTPGATVLQERGFPEWQKISHEDHFEHELMLSRVLLSLELGIRGSDTARHIPWSEMKESLGNIPKGEDPAALPYQFPVETKAGTETFKAFVRADGNPCGIDLGGRFLFFPGIEADKHTEPLEAGDWKRSSWKKKIKAYRYVIEHNVCQKRWGVPAQGFFIPCWFPTVARMNSVMRLIEKMTADSPSLRKHFLCKTMPILSASVPQAPATGHAFTAPFSRVAPFKPFSLITGKGVS